MSLSYLTPIVDNSVLESAMKCVPGAVNSTDALWLLRYERMNRRMDRRQLQRFIEERGVTARFDVQLLVEALLPAKKEEWRYKNEFAITEL